jgi:hypothetical protein
LFQATVITDFIVDFYFNKWHIIKIKSEVVCSYFNLVK